MMTGVHAIVFTADVEADRAFFGEVLDLPAVDAGGGWLLALYEPRHPSPLSSPDPQR